VVKTFLQGVTKEFKKIIWPTEKETKAYTFQVLVFVVILALFFFLVDGFIYQVLELLN